MKKLWEYSGWYLLMVGVIHTAAGFVLFQEPLLDILNAGIINSISVEMDLNAAYWFMFTGVLFIYMGWQWQEQIRRNKEPFSKCMGWGLTAITVIGIAIMPMTGLWLLLPLCVILLYYAYTFEPSE